MSLEDDLDALSREIERLRADLDMAHKFNQELAVIKDSVAAENDRLRADLAQANEVIDSLCHNIDRYRAEFARAIDALAAMLDQPHSGAHTAQCPTCASARAVLADSGREEEQA